MIVKPKSSGAAEFLKAYTESMDNTVMFQKSDPSRLYNLRCSQLPYCPSGVLLNWARMGTTQKIDMMMAYYTSVGHAVHKVMQDYISQTGQFLADYECRECHKKYRLSYQYECCGFPTAYEEVQIDVKTKKGRIQGHIDGIFKDSLGRIWIVDFKTSSLAGAPGKVSKAPIGYKRQVRAYAYLLKKQYGIEVHGCMLVYIPRDNPKKPSIWEYELSKKDAMHMREELLEDLRLHNKTMSAATLEDMKAVMGRNCGNTYCEACKKSEKEKLNILKKHLSKFPIKQ